MSRAILILDIAIILAALIRVMEQDADRRAVGLAVEHAGPDFRHVFLFPLRHDLGLAGPATAQIGHQIIHRKRQTGRTAVDNQQIARSMTHAGRGDAKQLAEGIAWHDENYTAARQDSEVEAEVPGDNLVITLTAWIIANLRIC